MTHRPSGNGPEKPEGPDVHALPPGKEHKKRRPIEDVLGVPRSWVVAALGAAVLIFCGSTAFYINYQKRKGEAEAHNKEDARIAMGTDGFIAINVVPGPETGLSTIVLGKIGEPRCFVDDVSYLIKWVEGKIVDTSDYTLRISFPSVGRSNVVVVDNASELNAILGPAPCTPTPEKPRPDNLR